MSKREEAPGLHVTLRSSLELPEQPQVEWDAERNTLNIFIGTPPSDKGIVSTESVASAPEPKPEPALQIHQPEDWAANLPWKRAGRFNPSAVTVLSFHISGAANGNPKYTPGYWARQTERFHMAPPRRWSGPAYNEAIGVDGSVWIMRGFRFENIAEGSPSRNINVLEHKSKHHHFLFDHKLTSKLLKRATYSIEFQEVGINSRTKKHYLPTDSAVSASIRRSEQLFAHLPNLRYVAGHNTWRAKQCPGRYVNDIINAGWFGPTPFKPFKSPKGRCRWVDEHGVNLEHWERSFDDFPAHVRRAAMKGDLDGFAVSQVLAALG